MNQYLTISLYLLLIIVSNSLKTTSNSTLKSLLNSKFKIKNGSKEIIQSVEFQGYFWVQIFDSTKDPVTYLEESERFNEYDYVVVNNEAIFLTPNAQNSNIVTSKYTILILIFNYI